MVFYILLSGEIKEKKKQVRFNIKQNCEKKKLVSPETISDSFISGWSQVY